MVAVAVAVVVDPLSGGAHEPERYAGAAADSMTQGVALAARVRQS